MDLQKLIDNYLEGKMNAEDQRLFEKLIEENPRYKTELSQQANGRAALRIAEQHSQKKPTNLKSWLLSGVIAITLVAAVLFLWTTLGMTPGEKLFTKHYAPLTKVNDHLLGSGHADLKAEAFGAYAAGDYAKAAQTFAQIPYSAESDYLLVYHGICQLELGRPEKAVPMLRMVKTGSGAASREVASWFAALGYFKLNMLDKGKNSLRVTAASPNPYQEQAKGILEMLE